ncbi:MAG TPA: hypothetical protein VEB41_00390 [Burkholderiales bacterium]|nr:hypothetical protein [Burkholderiales bacterium]
MNHRLAAATVCIASALTGACSSTSQPLPGAEFAALGRQTHIRVTHHPAAQVFTIEGTTENTIAMLFMPIVATPMVFRGMQMAKDLELRDPVTRVAGPLAASLKRALGSVEVVVTASEEDDDAAALARKLSGAMTLTVRTTTWGIDGYRARYAARARLLDLSQGRVAWEGQCAHVADADKPAPSMEALEADNGALLKAKLAQAADACAAQLAALVLKERAAQ